MSTFDTVHGISITIEQENGLHSVWLRCRDGEGMAGARACSCSTDAAALAVASGLFDVLLRATHIAEDAAVPRHTLTITASADALTRALAALR